MRRLVNIAEEEETVIVLSNKVRKVATDSRGTHSEIKFGLFEKAGSFDWLSKNTR